MATVWISIFFFGLCSLAHSASLGNPKIKQCAKLVNGCSIPGIGTAVSANLEMYNKIYDPACFKHDVCYSCGQYNGWDQHACDKAFLENMKAICHLRFSIKRYSWWEKMRIGMSLGYDMTAWLNIPDDTIEHCLHGANIFYKGVDGFGDANYAANSGLYQGLCQSCAHLGNPKDLIMQ